jgi:hypothetical protein
VGDGEGDKDDASFEDSPVDLVCAAGGICSVGLAPVSCRRDGADFWSVGGGVSRTRRSKGGVCRYDSTWSVDRSREAAVLECDWLLVGVLTAPPDAVMTEGDGGAEREELEVRLTSSCSGSRVAWRI